MEEQNSTSLQVRDEAMRLHADIMANMRAAAGAMVEFCRELKKMRDRKLYEALGYENFEDYCEQAVGVRQRQAYTYISVYERLSPQLLADNAGLGVTKLALLAQVSAPERAEFAAENDLAGMSVSEIKALVAEKAGMAEQLGMLEAEKKDAESSEEFLKKQLQQAQQEAERNRAALAEKEALIAALRKEPLDLVPGQLSEEEAEGAILAEDEGMGGSRNRELLRAKAEHAQEDAVREAVDAALAEERARVEAEHAQDLEDALEDARAEEEKEREKLLAEAARKAAHEAREQERDKLEKDVENARAEAAAAKAKAEKMEQKLKAEADAEHQRAEELAKKLKVAGDADTVRFSLLFGQLQDAYAAMTELLEEMRAAGKTEQAEKLGAALGKAMEAMRNG